MVTTRTPAARRGPADRQTRPQRASTTTELNRQAYRIGLTAALSAATVGLVAAALFGLLAWASTPRESASIIHAMQIAGRFWLLAHGVGMPTWAGGRVDIVPLAGTALVSGVLGLSLVRALRGAPRVLTRRPAVASLLGGVLAGYTAVGVTVAVVTSPTLVDWFPAVAGCVTVAVGTALIAMVWVVGVPAPRTRSGSAASTGGVRPVAKPPRLARRMGCLARGAAGGVTVVLLAGTLLAMIMVLTHLNRVADGFRVVDAGVVGTALLVLIQVAYVPVLALWGASVVVGPGFAFGMGASVSVGSSTVTEAPLVPVLAAVPQQASPVAAFLLLVPVVAGAVVARLTRRRGDSLTRAAFSAGAAGVLAGLGLGVVCVPARGALAAGYYSVMGPHPVVVGVVAAAEIGVSAFFAAAWWHRTRRLS